MGRGLLVVCRGLGGSGSVGGTDELAGWRPSGRSVARRCLAGPTPASQFGRPLASPADLDTWHVQQAWRSGHELPSQFFGLARYLPDGSIAAVAGPQILRLVENGAVRPWLSVSSQRHVHHLWPGQNGVLWIVYQPTPTAPEVLLQQWQTDGLSPEVRYERQWSSAATVSGGCVDGAGDLWLATTGGLIQVARDGHLTRQDTKPSHAVACGRDGTLQPPTGGELVELDRARRREGHGSIFPRLGQPVQIQRLEAEGDGEVLATVLFSSGQLAWWRRDASGRLVEGGLLASPEGLPMSASRILWEPSMERLLVATRDPEMRVWAKPPSPDPRAPGR